MKPTLKLVSLLALFSFACATITRPFSPEDTPLPSMPVQPGAANPDEPVFITGKIPYTSPFFLASTSEPFVLLEDQAGFVARDKEFEFALEGQAIGPVEFSDQEGSLDFSLSLPAIPQGTFLDVDNDGQDDRGVQIFAVAYWSNTWGGPFIERRDGTGWSTAHASTITDPERDGEIVGGILIVWAPDEDQSFPTGFGDDGDLFTDDDPAAPIPAGYNLVDLNVEPFRIYKEAQPFLELVEGASEVKDYSDESYVEAFETMFERVAKEYPFTEEKGIDWEELYDTFAPRVDQARDAEDFYRAIRDFTYAIPDSHVGLTIDSGVFFEEAGGGFGLVLAELSDGRLIVTEVLPGTSANRAGIEVGAEILSWNNQPVQTALEMVQPYFGPYSTDHHRRAEQVIFLTRVPPETEVQLSYQNPGSIQAQTTQLEAEVEYDSLFAALSGFGDEGISLPLETQLLEDSGLGYIRVDTFLDDFNLMARLWERAIQGLVDNEVPGLIIDARVNGGGSTGLAQDFAGYFTDETLPLYQRSYYSEASGEFEYQDPSAKVQPAPLYYDGKIAVLVSVSCFSACEGFSYALSQIRDTVIVGHTPTAGAFGEVGQGQYELPEGLSLQFPTGRPETMDGQLLIEGLGVEPDLLVPVTEASALGQVDAVLEVAIEALLDAIGN